MAEKITKEMRKKYVDGGGGKCPHCGSDQIEGGSINVEGCHAFQIVHCLECEKIWHDKYTLTGVIPSY